MMTKKGVTIMYFLKNEITWLLLPILFVSNGDSDLSKVTVREKKHIK